jgi:hypothetical protein
MEAEAAWQLVGHTAVRRCSSGRRTQDLKVAIGRELNIAPQWLEVSWQTQRLSGDELLPEDVVSSREHASSTFTPLLISLILPRFARPCTEAWVPRGKRHRVTNQAAVAALAWLPGLHGHELEDDSSHTRAAPVYPVFVSGIAGFPAPLLRLDMGVETPTVSVLHKKLHEVTGSYFDITVRALPLLGSSRQYLHRLGILAGTVVSVERPREYAFVSPPISSSISSSIAKHSFHSPPVLPAITIDEDTSEDSTQCAARKRQKRASMPAMILPHAGALWSGSSRKRMLSTGQQAERGPNGNLALQNEGTKMQQEQAGVRMPSACTSGGFD